MGIESPGPARPFVRWRVAERFQVLPMGSGEYRFVSASQNVGVRIGKLVPGILDTVLPLLEQGCYWNDLVGLVGDEREEEMATIVNDLAGRGLLEEVRDEAEPGLSSAESEYYRSQRKFFANFQSRATQAPVRIGSQYEAGPVASSQKRLKDSKVLIAGLGKAGINVARMLAQAGVGSILGADQIRVTAEDVGSGYDATAVGGIRQDEAAKTIEGTNPFICYSALPDSVFALGSFAALETLNLVILCEDEVDPEHYREINQLCLDRSISWTSLRSVGFRVEVGPWIVPRETACYQCLELRKSGNIPFYDHLRTAQQRMREVNGTTGGLNVALGCEVLVLEVIKILGAFSRPMTYGTMFTFDLVSLESRLHAVLKVPRCAACGAQKLERPTVSIWRPGSDFENF